MLETILQWDENTFFWINQNWSNGFFDVLFPLFRNKYFWIPLYLFILSFSAFNFGQKTWWLLGFALLTIVACDQMSSEIVKEVFQRPRPCKTFSDIHLLIHCGSGYSFTSSHATNHFGVGTFFLWAFAPVMKGWKYLFWCWAGVISLAQVYVGVHYPLDVLGGAVLGVIIGWVFYIMFRKLSGGLI